MSDPTPAAGGSNTTLPAASPSPGRGRRSWPGPSGGGEGPARMRVARRRRAALLGAAGALPAALVARAGIVAAGGDGGTGRPGRPGATTGAAGLKRIDPGALQAQVAATARELLVPGALVLLRTPQGQVTVAYGTTQLGTTRPPRADTRFRIASVTKTMTAAVILQLAQEGKLRLGDPVSKYVPGVPNGDGITLAQLLEMRSGLYSYTDAPELAAGIDDDPARVWTPPELLAMAFARPPMFAPGAEYYYGNTNYVLLGLIIEQADGRPLATAFAERLFAPLGLTDTLLPPATSNAIPEPYSHGYLYGSSAHVLVGTPPYTPETAAAARAGTLRPTDYTGINHSWAHAAGGVVSTAADLATWMEALVGGRVLDAEYQRVWQDSAQIIDPGNPYSWYGYGIDQLRWGPNTVALHGGQTPGYNSEAAHDPTNAMTLIVWTNLTKSPDERFTAMELTLDVLDQIYAVPPRPAPAAAS